MKKACTPRNRVNKLSLLVFFFAIVSGLISLLPRIDGKNFIKKSLWAEDGAVFFNQAAQHGIESIWTPYAGYLLLYPRLIAQIGNWVDLKHVPQVYFWGWVLAFGVAIVVIVWRARMYGISIPVTVLLVPLISLQPNNGEVFFTLTNAQWFLAMAVTLYLLVPQKERPSSLELGLLVLASLTGPFSILILPVLTLQLFLFRDFEARKSIYLVVTLCAVLQALIIFKSGRVSSGVVDTNLLHWLIPVKAFLFYGGGHAFISICSLLSWILFGYVLLRPLHPAESQMAYKRKIALTLILAASLFFAGGLVALKNGPIAFSPLGDGGRYFLVPYALVFFAMALLSTARPLIFFLWLLTIATISGMQFRGMPRAELQYSAFAEFAKAKGDVIIPINPPWSSEFPGWHIEGSHVSNGSATSSIQKPIRLDLSKAHVHEAIVHFINDKLMLRSASEDPQVVMDIKSSCFGTRYIGLEVELWRERAGWSQIFWSNSAGFNEYSSLRRYYPAGGIAMQFAFNNAEGNTFIRFDPMEWQGEAIIKKIDLYCLAKKAAR